MNRMRTWPGLVAAAAASLALAAPAAGQTGAGELRRTSVEVRGGFAVPTFEIADVADAGPAFGVGLGVAVTPRVWLLGDADFGFHSGAGDGRDVNVHHYMGKVGLELLEPGTGRWSVMVNAGAGAMTFDVDLAEADSRTYFGINVGAKLGYAIGETADLLISPQGDVAFSDADEVGTDNAWVWPFTAGIRFRF